MTLRSRTLISIGLLAAALQAQFDDRLWLVQDVASGPGQVVEIDRAGSLIATYPGPTFGSSGVAKDLFLNRVWVCDDGFPNLPGQALGAIRGYTSGVGNTSIIPLPGARGIVVMSNGDVAVLINENPFAPSRVQIVPSNWIGQPLPPQIPVGQFATTIKAGPGLTLWTLNRISRTISRLQSGTAATIVPAGTGAVDKMVLMPDGGVLVTHALSLTATVIDESGTLVTTLDLPEPADQIASDSDRAVLMIGASGMVHRLALIERVAGGYDVIETDAFQLGPGTYRSIIPDLRSRFWIEEQTGPTVRRYRFSGIREVSVTPPFATATRGDPLGLEWATRTNPASDVDNDNVASGDEVRRGTDVLDGSDFPPMLTVAPINANGIIALTLTAPGRENLPVFITASLTGNNPTPLGFDLRSAPYYDLSIIDFLAIFIASGEMLVQPHFPGMSVNALNSSGTMSAGVDLSAWPNLQPGLFELYCAAVVWEPNFQGVSATSNTVRFDNVGMQLPL